MSKKFYLTNPITDELVRDGIIEVSKREELRIIKDKEGNTHQEIAVTIRYKDPRKFVKSFPDFNTKMLQLFEGNSKAQMPYILAAAIERSINKDYVYLTHRDVISICEDRGVKPLDKTQLSKGIKWLIDNEVLFRVQGETGRYFFNTKLNYNGMFARQVGLMENEE